MLTENLLNFWQVLYLVVYDTRKIYFIVREMHENNKRNNTMY